MLLARRVGGFQLIFFSSALNSSVFNKKYNMNLVFLYVLYVFNRKMFHLVITVDPIRRVSVHNS